MNNSEALRFGLLLLICVVVVVPSVVMPVHAVPLAWLVETVDAAYNVGSYTSLVLDSNDHPHISYYDWYWYDLKYAVWTGFAWVIEQIDTGGTVGSFTSIAIDSGNRPHISYCDGTNDKVKYAWWTGSSWSIEAVDSAHLSETSIALDSLNLPRISYTGSSGFLKYARWTGSEWTLETVDTGCVVISVSLALDASGHPHISYYDATNEDLKYAWWTGSAWAIETVDSGGDVGYHTSLALDSSDHPHISYYDYTNENLKYARWTGSTWSIETVDAATNVGVYPSLALDSNDHPHISYHDDYWSDLKYAWWTGTAWFVKNVDSVGTVGAYTSLALDSGDHPHISYYDADTGNLKYASDPDESIYSTSYPAFDANGDGFNDGVEVVLDVDTTYTGTLNVTVHGVLTNGVGTEFDSSWSRWEITGNAVEYGSVTLQLPEGAPEGEYNLLVELYDERGGWEDGSTFTDAVYLYPPNRNPTIESCNAFGEQHDSFDLAEAIAVMGEGYVPSTSYAVYVVVDTTWTDGLAIPSRVADTATTITSNAEGGIEPTVVWATPLSEGAFDVVVDTNGNGQYDAGVDGLDDSDIEVTAGWIVIPEFPGVLLLPVFLGLTITVAVLRRRRSGSDILKMYRS